MSDPNYPLTLRLLAHPGLGAQGISESERQILIGAAAEIERLGRIVELLGNTLTDAIVERDG